MDFRGFTVSLRVVYWFIYNDDVFKQKETCGVGRNSGNAIVARKKSHKIGALTSIFYAARNYARCSHILYFFVPHKYSARRLASFLQINTVGLERLNDISNFLQVK